MTRVITYWLCELIMHLLCLLVRPEQPPWKVRTRRGLPGRRGYVPPPPPVPLDRWDALACALAQPVVYDAWVTAPDAPRERVSI